MKDEKIIVNAVSTGDETAKILTTKMVHMQLERWTGDFLKSSTHTESCIREQ